MAYIDDIVLATETVEDHMVRLCEAFECLREAGFKMRIAKCDFLKSEIKYLGRVVSVEGIKPDPKAGAKLRDWDIPRSKTGMQSFLGFANYCREFIPWHAKLVATLHTITGVNATFTWGLNSNRPSMKSRRCLSRIQTRQVNLCWTLTLAQWRLLVFCTNDKVLQVTDISTLLSTAARS